MTALPENVFRANDLLYFASQDDPLLWYVVPGQPVPDLDPATPALQNLGGTVRLALAAHWLDLNDDVLAALAASIAQLHDIAGAVKVQVLPAPLLQVGGMQLELADAAGQPHVLDSSRTSGVVPWQAVFSSTLDAPAAARAAAALEDGRTGLLTLTMRYALSLQMGVRVTIDGEVAAPDSALLARLAAQPDPRAAATLIDAALASGALRQQVQTDLAPDAALVRATCDQAREQAAMLQDAHLASQTAAWSRSRPAPAAQADQGMFSKMFGGRRPPEPAPFAARPLPLQVTCSQAENFRIPPQHPDDNQSWLRVTTDLGAWSAGHRHLR